MAKARQILKRAKAVKNIRTVTKTMQMVATARFKKTHNQVVATRAYADRLAGIVGDIFQRGQGAEFSHPLMRENKAGRDVLLVLTSNRGLCGAYNSSVLRAAVERYDQLKAAGHEVLLHVSGKRGIQYFRFRGYKLAQAYTQFDHAPAYTEVAALVGGFRDEFLQGHISGLEVAYMQFISSARQRPAISQVLPLSNLEAPPRTTVTAAAPPAYEFLPSPGEVLDSLLPLTVQLRVYQCFLNAAVAEQVARMTAMQSATENADDMIRELTILYNRTRQSQITTELSEIMGGRAGIEGS